MEYIDREKLEKLSDYLRYSLNEYIEEVLNDSKEVPEVSAVTLNNLIICYIDFLNSFHFGVFKSVKSFFIFCGYTEEDYGAFKRKVDLESKYYVGKQFREKTGNG